MKKSIQIAIFFLSVVVFLSPLLAFTSVIESTELEAKHEMSCCVVDSEADAHACCKMDGQEKSSNKCGDEKPCHQNTCHIGQFNHLNFHSNENQVQTVSFPFFVKKSKIDTYHLVQIKEISLSTWKPPKINS